MFLERGFRGTKSKGYPKTIQSSSNQKASNNPMVSKVDLGKRTEEHVTVGAG